VNYNASIAGLDSLWLNSSLVFPSLSLPINKFPSAMAGGDKDKRPANMN